MKYKEGYIPATYRYLDFHCCSFVAVSRARRHDALFQENSHPYCWKSGWSHLQILWVHCFHISRCQRSCCAGCWPGWCGCCCGRGLDSGARDCYGGWDLATEWLGGCPSCCCCCSACYADLRSVHGGFRGACGAHSKCERSRVATFAEKRIFLRGFSCAGGKESENCRHQRSRRNPLNSHAIAAALHGTVRACYSWNPYSVLWQKRHTLCWATNWRVCCACHCWRRSPAPQPQPRSNVASQSRWAWVRSRRS